MYRDNIIKDKGCGNDNRMINIANVSFNESNGIMGVIASILFDEM